MKLGYRILFIASLLVITAYFVGLDINLNIPDLWYKMVDFVEKNYEYGGWHKLGVCILVCSPMLIWCVLKSFFQEESKEAKNDEKKP
jgi:hypothetical protein